MLNFKTSYLCIYCKNGIAPDLWSGAEVPDSNPVQVEFG